MYLVTALFGDSCSLSCSDHYKKTQYSGDLILRACGELVAAKYPEDDHWYRAQVMLASEEQIEVKLMWNAGSYILDPNLHISIQRPWDLHDMPTLKQLVNPVSYFL